MKHLPSKKTLKQKIIINACFDYYGTGISGEDTKVAKKIALYLMGRRKGIVLTEEEKSDLLKIKTNLKDKTYSDSFLEPTM